MKEYEDDRFRVGCRYPELRELLTLIPVQYDAPIRRFGTDGTAFLCGRKLLWEDYVHTLIHMLCGHIPVPEGRYASVWNMACDMAAEYIRTLMFPDDRGERIRQDVKAVLGDRGGPWKAEDLYLPLMDLYEDELQELAWGFSRDDHSLWKKPGMEGKLPLPGTEEVLQPHHVAVMGEEADPAALISEILEKQWTPLLEALVSGEMESGRWGLTPGSAEERAVLRERNQLDFTRYLRRFSVFGEEMMLDEDSFDQIPYTYGLKLYGNLPMVEPLEYADCYRVEDLIIAIDTSGSCSVELVQEFLGEIRHILLDHDAFFRKMNVHIVQCDAYVREHVVIRSREDWDRYAEEIDIKGRRGTDFRPVFRMAEDMVKNGEFKRLKGLFYFTDGEGIYPEWEPEFETAFIYSTAEALTRPGIPDWVTKLSMELPDIR